MWLKWPGTRRRHFSQSARYPMLNDFFMPGCQVHELTVCLERMWPRCPEDGVAGADDVSGLDIECERVRVVVFVGSGDSGVKSIIPIVSTALRASKVSIWGLACNWFENPVSRTIPGDARFPGGENMSSPSLIGDGSLLVCTVCQSESAVSMVRGTDLSSAPPPNPGWCPILRIPCGRGCAAGSGLPHAIRSWAAKFGRIGVGILPAIVGATGSGWNGPGSRRSVVGDAASIIMSSAHGACNGDGSRWD